MTGLKRFIGLIAMCVLVSWSAAAMAEEIVVGFTGPLSGPAAEYGQDCLNGVDLAVKELNAAGGIVVKGKRYTFKLEKLDDRNDPTLTVNNARRVTSSKGIAIFNPVFSSIAALGKINQEKGNEFIIMAYTSTPKVVKMGNKLLVGTTAPPFTVYLQIFADTAWKRGWRKAAMLVTLGAYGDEWRQAFKEYWQKIGGTVTMDKPANYYKETDFSTHLSAILDTKPHVILIGGPSSTTALVIEQARGMGYKGGFIMVDQAKPDVVSQILKGYKKMDNTICVAGARDVQVPVTASFINRYTAAYKRNPTSEVQRHYGGMIALSRAIVAAGTVDNVPAIRAAFSKALPILGNTLPTEIFGINDNGRLLINGAIQEVKNGKAQAPVQYFWWMKTQQEWNTIKKITKSKMKLNWFKPTIKDVM